MYLYTLYYDIHEGAEYAEFTTKGDMLRFVDFVMSVDGIITWMERKEVET